MVDTAQAGTPAASPRLDADALEGLPPTVIEHLAAAISEAYPRWRVTRAGGEWHAHRRGDLLASSDPRVLYAVHAGMAGLLLLQLDYQDKLPCEDDWRPGDGG